MITDDILAKMLIKVAFTLDRPHTYTHNSRAITEDEILATMLTKLS
jgi:hypothetical protein